MRSFLVFLQFSLLLTCLLSCKRLAYDPLAYDDLLYKAPEKVIPPKEYIFKTTLKSGTFGVEKPKVDTSWNTKGTAIINDDTLTITGSKGEDIFTIKLRNYKNQSVFSIGTKRDTATLVIKIAGKTVKYVSKGRAHGKVNIVKFDNSYNQVEANFDMVLYSTTSSKDSITVSSGYFKINFSPNAISWLDTGFDRKAQVIRATKGTFYEIIGIDTINKAAVTIKIPINFGVYSFGMKIPLGYNGTSVSYTDSVSNFINIKAFETGSIKPSITVTGIADNVIKGRFDNIHLGGTNPDDNYLYGLDGSFSAKF